MIDTDKYEGHTLSLESVLSGYFTIEQIKEVDKTLMEDAPLILDAYNKKCNEVKWLREALQIITKDLDSAIAQGHIPIRATDGIDVKKIISVAILLRNFAHDASL
jgi:hypothetical protein